MQAALLPPLLPAQPHAQVPAAGTETALALPRVHKPNAGITGTVVWLAALQVPLIGVMRGGPPQSLLSQEQVSASICEHVTQQVVLGRAVPATRVELATVQLGVLVSLSSARAFKSKVSVQDFHLTPQREAYPPTQAHAPATKLHRLQ